MSDEADAVVIGAGINGLVAAAELAGAGWTVVLLETRDRLGGFIDSEKLTIPGHVHDTFSSWHPLFVAGGAYAELGAALHQRGLEYANTDDAVTASISERGVVMADRDPETTVARLAHSADQAAYLTMLDELDRRASVVFGVLGSELRARDIARLGTTALRSLGVSGAVELARVAVQSGRGFVRERFTGWEADQLWTPWLLHAGLGPDHAAGGLMLPVMAATVHRIGLPVVKGGARQFIAAFERLLADRGVEVRLGVRAERIEVTGGRAVAVHAGGRRIAARKAVLVSTSTGDLYDRLLDRDAATENGRRAARLHRPGRAAMQIHLALDERLRWSDARLDPVPLVHISNGADSTGIACAQAEAGLLPAAPTVVVGQQTVLDPSRAPEGAGTLWIQLQELPFAPRGDAAGEIDVATAWSEEVVAAYADRVIDRIAQFAPGLRDSIRCIAALPPPALLAANPNAVAGDPYGAAAELDQSLLWRPGTGTGHRTGFAQLWHIGAFTHPGAGLGGGSGHIVAQQLLSTGSVRARIRRPRAGEKD
ncbi:phytoene dehydrogenase-like protein [Nonomuraea thailandensis]|uniref:Pyridine nucleotide-disulfide oxidoreductase domain-containing protein 2 n=1 Tax=Nonomuraea thailandensis TaxID=1188745 RepID=A0A9X2GG40_9ACTN|nr:NAD(P)/FAD-dependent oxidoreductase [Nonomuraea thailandensis]MCP2358251.1 phytoene dehydrogenase-like protein [Nonomuraea thailandensis]